MMKIKFPLFAALSITSWELACASDDSATKDGIVFVRGAPLVGGSNGLAFDDDNNLWVAQVFGRRLSKIDPETGEVLDEITLQDDGAAFPDDVTVGNDGTVYWTDVILGTVSKKDMTTGVTTPFFEVGSYPSANPLTLSDDGSRLYFSRCFDFEDPNLGIYEVDLLTGDTVPILEGIPLCASNAMDYYNGSLWSPRPFEQRIVRIDLNEPFEGGEIAATRSVAPNVTNVTTGLVSVAVHFDSKGQLYSLDNGQGQIVQIDLSNPDKTNNRQVVADFPNLGLDNFAFDKDDRLFVSSFTRGYVQEVLPSGELRVVSSGNLSATSGMAIQNGVLYTNAPLVGIFGYDIETGDEVFSLDGIPGDGKVPPNLGVAAGPSDNLLLFTSFLHDIVTVWDIDSQSSISQCVFAGAPNDAMVFGTDGGFLVLESGIGVVTKVTGCGEEYWDSDEVVLLASPEAGLRNMDGDDKNVFVTQTLGGQVLQIIKDGETLKEPIVIVANLDQPEGIAVVPGGKDIVVVATGTGTVEQVNLDTGVVTRIAEDLAFFPALGQVMPAGFVNDVVVYDGYAFVNADMENVIYKVPLAKDKPAGEDEEAWSEVESSSSSSDSSDEDVDTVESGNSGPVMQLAPRIAACMFIWVIRAVCA